MAVEVLALVKHDCPVCDQVLPALDSARAAGAPVTILSQSAAPETRAQATRLGLGAVPALDVDLQASVRFDPDAVPVVFLLDGGEERERLEGLQRDRLRDLLHGVGADVSLDDLPAQRPGCASLTRDPVIAAGLEARAARAQGRLRARELEIGDLEDPIEALHDRGLTDGLPVVPPTPERVVAMLAGTSRHPQEVVATLPPYDGVATVEKVAINAVMAGCRPDALPVVLAAVEAAAAPEFGLHGVLATTHSAGPLVVVSGPLADEIGMNSHGNCLGQDNRASTTVGRALQLTVRNVGGGRPRREDRAMHGHFGKIGACFAERLDGMPWEPLAQARGVPEGETGVTLFAAEGPRMAVDQLVRDPDELARRTAMALEAVGHPQLRRQFDALVLFGPEYGRIFAEAGWTRERVRDRLFELSHRRAADCVRSGLDQNEQIAGDPDALVPKFAAPDRILIAYAGGDAGLFSSIFGSWMTGDMGSLPVTRSVEPWR